MWCPRRSARGGSSSRSIDESNRGRGCTFPQRKSELNELLGIAVLAILISTSAHAVGGIDLSLNGCPGNAAAIGGEVP